MNQNALTPTREIHLKNGRVKKIIDGYLCNGIPAEPSMERDGDTFTRHIDDPEHGSSARVGNFLEVTAGMHMSVFTDYQQAFMAEQPSDDFLLNLFPGFIIIRE